MSIKEEKRAKVKDLIALALDGAAAPEEQRSTAVRAIKIIRKYKLLDTPPLDGILENDTVRAVKAVADKFADPELIDGLKTLFKQASTVRRRRR